MKIQVFVARVGYRYRATLKMNGMQHVQLCFMKVSYMATPKSDMSVLHQDAVEASRPSYYHVHQINPMLLIYQLIVKFTYQRYKL